MKNQLLKKSIFSILLLLSLTTLFSCASTGEKKVDPNFIADFDPFYLGEVICLSKTTFGDNKPLTIHFYFNPRNNCIDTRFKEGINQISMIWTPAQRELLSKGILEYMALYNSDTKMEDRKPTKKNAFFKSKIELSWGVTGPARTTMANYFANYQYLEPNKPYFKLHFVPTPYQFEEYVSSPKIELFFSPNQLEKLFEITDYDLILEKIKSFESEAYDW